MFAVYQLAAFLAHPARRFFLPVISIIIPTLNEEYSMLKTLEALLCAAGKFEIIVEDDNSDDSTKAIASKFGPVITSPRARGLQMNCGAAEARRNLLLILHANTAFPPNGIHAIEQSIENSQNIGWNFDIHYDDDNFSSRVFTLINRWRCSLRNFLRRFRNLCTPGCFYRLGGFRPLPLMEDYDFARRMARTGKTVCLNESLLVSARRWEEHGLIRTMASWFIIYVFYYLELRGDFLTRFYLNIRSTHVSGRKTAKKKPIDNR